ncbi:MFS family permease [Streptomyces sp. V4I23]|uniref:MFS transporter n=1 Tax=Streptomyces sp. V4I23 TaxID=3042282 RepID=UPI0027890EA0|nr:MFS transporter [Streptomyces sp. V4I23]MDQ1010943.1 MFS family permease [Streptomyces sp. V4I23]
MPSKHRALTAPAGAGYGLVYILGLAATVVAMMQTLVVPVLTVIRDELSLTASAAGWLTTATLLSAAVFTPLLGRLGDMRGKRPVLIGILLVTVAGSVLGATTSSLPLLLTARAMQGASTAIFPLALSVLRDELEPRRLPGAMGLISGTLAAGAGLALVGAGLLTQGTDPDYHRVFWMATALSVIALVGVVATVPPSRETTGGRTDWVGAATLAAALVLFLLPVSQGSTWGWASPRTLILFAAAAVLATVWVVVERHVSEPLVDMTMFVFRPVLFTNIAGVLLGFGMFTQFIGIAFLARTPRELAGYGFSASVLGAATTYLLPSTLASLIAAQLGGTLVRRIGARVTLAAGAASGVAGFVWLALAHDSTASVVTAGILTGIAVSFGFAALPALIAAGVPAHQSGIANGINSIARSVGSSAGSAVITILLAANTLPHLPPGTPALPAETQYSVVFTLGALAFALIALVALTGLNFNGTAPSRIVRQQANSLHTPSVPPQPAPLNTVGN